VVCCQDLNTNNSVIHRHLDKIWQYHLGFIHNPATLILPFLFKCNYLVHVQVFLFVGHTVHLLCFLWGLLSQQLSVNLVNSRR